MDTFVAAVAVILFPGLVAAIICDKIAVHSRRWGTFKYVVYSFVLGVSSYSLVQLALWGGDLIIAVASRSTPELNTLHVWSMATAQHADVIPFETVAASLAAPVVAALAAFVNSHKILNRLAQHFNISRKYGDENLMSYYLTTDEIKRVYIRDPSVNQTYEGRVWAYSENDSIQEVVLAEVTVYNYETADELYKLPTLYLARPIGTFAIEQAIPTQQGEPK